MNEPKKLYRVERGAMLSGVCGGLAEYFNLDISLVRLLWVVGSVLTGGVGGVALYVAAAVILPKKSDVYPGY